MRWARGRRGRLLAWWALLAGSLALAGVLDGFGQGVLIHIEFAGSAAARPSCSEHGRRSTSATSACRSGSTTCTWRPTPPCCGSAAVGRAAARSPPASHGSAHRWGSRPSPPPCSTPSRMPGSSWRSTVARTRTGGGCWPRPRRGRSGCSSSPQWRTSPARASCAPDAGSPADGPSSRRTCRARAVATNRRGFPPTPGSRSRARPASASQAAVSARRPTRSARSRHSTSVACSTGRGT